MTSLQFQVFASLDYEGQFLGKEIVGLVANGLGRSVSAVILAMMTSNLPFFYSRAPFLLVCISTLWLLMCCRVVDFLLQGKKKESWETEHKHSSRCEVYSILEDLPTNNNTMLTRPCSHGRRGLICNFLKTLRNLIPKQVYGTSPGDDKQYVAPSPRSDGMTMV